MDLATRFIAVGVLWIFVGTLITWLRVRAQPKVKAVPARDDDDD